MSLKGIKKFFNAGHKIQRKKEVTHGFGGESAEWETILTIYGRLRPLSGGEPQRADQFPKKVDAVFYCNFGHGIDQEDRYVSPEGDIYYIEFIKNPMTMDNHLEIGLEYYGKMEEAEPDPETEDAYFMQASFPTTKEGE